MKCSKCGYEVKENWKFCPKCQNGINRNDKSKIYNRISLFGITISLLFFLIYQYCKFLGLFVDFFDAFSVVLMPASFIILIISKLKYPKNKDTNILLSLMIILFGTLIILIAISGSLEFLRFLQGCPGNIEP